MHCVCAAPILLHAARWPPRYPSITLPGFPQPMEGAGASLTQLTACQCIHVLQPLLETVLLKGSLCPLPSLLDVRAVCL